MQQTAQQALEQNKVGQSSNWTNSANGHLGTVTPIETFESDPKPCRRYQITASVEGRTAIGYDTACRRADGVWVSSNFDSLIDALEYAQYRRDRYDRYPYYDDPWCDRPGRWHSPYCGPRSGLSVGVGTRF